MKMTSNSFTNMPNDLLLEEYNYRHNRYMDYHWRDDSINWSVEEENKAWLELREVKNEILRRMGEDI